jgi:hypothetical protein
MMNILIVAAAAVVPSFCLVKAFRSKGVLAMTGLLAISVAAICGELFFTAHHHIG